MKTLELGQKLWLEPAEYVMTRWPQCFISGEVVLFDSKHAINMFANDPTYIPIKELE